MADHLGKLKMKTQALRNLLLIVRSLVYEMGKLRRPCLLFRDKETRRWSELGTSSRKDLRTVVTPTTISGDAPTTPSIYV